MNDLHLSEGKFLNILFVKILRTSFKKKKKRGLINILSGRFTYQNIEDYSFVVLNILASFWRYLYGSSFSYLLIFVSFLAFVELFNWQFIFMKHVIFIFSNKLSRRLRIKN